jgi:hypothetical protein
MRHVIRVAYHPGWSLLCAAVVAALALTGCGHSHAASAAAPLVSSTFTQQQITVLENELTTAFQQQLTAHPGHPASDAKAALKTVFPGGDTAKIEAYAVKHFTPAVLATKGPGSARDAWVKLVVADAVNSGDVTPPAITPSPLGSADIPGVTSPSAGSS